MRAWDPATAKQLFFMAGFEPDVSSLCLQHNMLVTNGMKQFVCVNDFGVDKFELSKDDFEMDF